MTGTPIQAAIVNGVPVPKAGVRSAIDGSLVAVYADAAAVRARDLTTQFALYVLTLKAYFQRDATDTTSADDGVTVLVDAAGNRWIRPRGTILKTTDEARTSTATLTNDAALKLTLAANNKYRIKGTVFFDTAATPDFKWALTGPSSPTLVRVARRWIIPGGSADAGILIDTAYTTSQSVVGAGSTGGRVELDAIIHNNANAGLFAFQWAQDTANASATTVRAGSSLDYERL